MIINPISNKLRRDVDKTIAREIQLELFQHVMKADIEFFEKYNTNEIYNFLGNTYALNG
jgi:ABC-type bacteriocin/lantibiotic exporter with double-glycine peptidase domain